MPFIVIGTVGLVVAFFVSPHGSDTATMSAIGIGLFVTSIANLVVGTVQLARRT